MKLCTVKDGNPGSNPVADDVAIASVAKLLEYAFDCASSILALIDNPQSFQLPSTPEEAADGDVDNNSDDEFGKTCDILESTNVFNTASGSTRRDGGGSGKGHKGGGGSGKGRCHSDIFGVTIRFEWDPVNPVKARRARRSKMQQDRIALVLRPLGL